MTEILETTIRTAVIDLFLGGDQSFPLETDTHLVQSGICDSLGLVKLAATLEARFPGLRIHDQDITHETMGTVRAISRLIESKGVAS